VTVTAGQTPTFTVVANGTAPLSYQWQKNGTNISGATGASYTTTATTSADSGATFAVVVSNSNGSVTSSSATLTVAVATTATMALSSNGRYLVNPSTGQPVFLVGDAPQDIAEMLDSAQVTQYLNDRANRGVNALWVLVSDMFQINPPLNYYGYSPFDGANFTNEDANYFANIDSIVTQAGNLGMTVFLNPAFVGHNEPGYLSSYTGSTDAVVQAYGTWLGQRYAGFPNIVWALGGDSWPSDSGLYTKLTDLGNGIHSADPNHLITLEACEMCATNGYNSVQGFQAAGLSVPSWLKVNWIYPSQSDTVGACNNGFNSSPFLPPMVGEDHYELENNTTPAILRFEGYSEILSGCYVGRIFGNGAMWSFNSNGSSCVNGTNTCHGATPSGPNPSVAWQNQLNSPGIQYQTILGKLFRSREHWLLVPDISHTVVTAGYGSGLTVATTARTSDGQTIIAYIPNGNATSIVVDMAKITSATSTVQGWWYNPQTAATTYLGTFPNSGTHSFTPPDANDWVLILDDANANLPAPGSSTLLAP